MNLLATPAFYDAVQLLLGADRGRRDWVDNFVRARAGDRVLDVGCGTARILDYLPDGISYWGVDIDARYIEAARNRYGRRAVFSCGELRALDLRAAGPFDVVLAAGVLHHMDDQAASGFLGLAKSVLRAGGRLVTIDPCYAERQNAVARLLISRDRGRYVRPSNEYLDLAKRHFDRSAGTIRHRAWIPYTHWIMECTNR